MLIVVYFALICPHSGARKILFPPTLTLPASVIPFNLLLLTPLFATAFTSSRIPVIVVVLFVNKTILLLPYKVILSIISRLSPLVNLQIDLPFTII